MSILTSTGIIELLEEMSSQPLDIFFKGITTIFSPVMLIMYSVFIFWLGDKKRWIIATIFMMFVILSSLYFKALFRVSRPPETLHRVTAEGYGFPSGHTAAITGAAGWLMYLKRSYSFIIFGTLITVLVAFSRLYLGVHYIRDLIGGLILGTIMVLTGILFRRRKVRLLSRLQGIKGVMLVLCVTLFTVLFSVYSEYKTDSGLQLTGLFLGFCLGRMGFLARYPRSPFEMPLSRCDVKRGGKRIFIGMVMVAGPLWLGNFLKELETSSTAFFGFIFLNYTIIGFLISFLIPLVFIKTERPLKTSTK